MPRPKKTLEQVDNVIQKVASVDQPRVKTNRKERVPVNGASRNLLTIQHRDPDFRYRWVLNDPDRVAKFEDGWWEIDTDPRNQKVGDRRVDTPAGTSSSVVETKAGMGRKYVLMKLPRELWEQDQKAKQDEVDRIEAEIVREAKKDRYGKLEVDRSGRTDSTAPVGS